MTVTRHDSAFIDSEHARILAHAMSEVPESSRPLVYQLIDLVTASVTPMATSTAEMYTALGRQGFDTPAIFQRIVAEARAAPSYQPLNPDVVAEPLPGLSIVVGYGPWLEALAVLGAERTLPRDAVEILEKHANDPSLRTEIVRALAHQAIFLTVDCSNSDCSRTLKAFLKDGVGRQLASDVLAEQLAKLPRDKFLVAIEDLRKKRAAEIEPEVRIAIGLSIIDAQLVRIRTKPVGSQLCE